MAIDKSKIFDAVRVDKSLDLLSNQISVPYRTTYGDTLVRTLTPEEQVYNMYFGVILVKSEAGYPVSSSLKVNVGSNTKSVSSDVTCHDITYKLKRSWFRHLYLYSYLKNDDGSYHVPTDESGEEINFTAAKIMNASDVLRTALISNGISLRVSWGIPNYSVVNKMSRSRMFDTDLVGLISELVSPFQVTEAFGVYIFVENDVLYIKKHNPLSSSIEMSMTGAHIKGFTLQRQLVLKPTISKVIIEYYDEKPVDVGEKTSITVENVEDKNGDVIAKTVSTKVTICDVLVRETQEVTRALTWVYDGTKYGINLYPVSDKSTVYTYDNPPEILDPDGMFMPNRVLEGKIITETHYYFPDMSKIVWKTVKAAISYGYVSKKLVNEIEASEYYNNVGELWKTTKGVTNHIQLDSNKVEIKLTNYLDDEITNSASTIREGKLQEAPKVSENDASNQSWDIKYLTIQGGVAGMTFVTGFSNVQSQDTPSGSGGSSTAKVVRLQNKLLTKEQLSSIAKEILKEGSYTKIIINIDLAPMVWIPRGTIMSIGTLFDETYTLIEGSTGLVEGQSIDLSDIAGIPFIVANQSCEYDKDSLTGTLSLVGYKFL